MSIEKKQNEQPTGADIVVKTLEQQSVCLHCGRYRTHDW
jgi:hypothetical protein